MSPRSMRLASVTSCSAVSSSTRPIERRYSRSESRLGSTVRSISGFFGASGALRLAARRPGPRFDLPVLRRGGLAVGADDVDARAPPGSACSSRTCSLVTSTSSRHCRDLLEGQKAPFLALRDKGRGTPRPRRSALRPRAVPLVFELTQPPLFDATSRRHPLTGRPSPVCEVVSCSDSSATEAAMGLSLVSLARDGAASSRPA